MDVLDGGHTESRERDGENDREWSAKQRIIKVYIGELGKKDKVCLRARVCVCVCALKRNG